LGGNRQKLDEKKRDTAQKIDYSEKRGMPGSTRKRSFFYSKTAKKKLGVLRPEEGGAFQDRKKHRR